MRAAVQEPFRHQRQRHDWIIGESMVVQARHRLKAEGERSGARR